MEKFIEKPRHIEVQILGEWGRPWVLSGLRAAALQELSLGKPLPQEGRLWRPHRSGPGPWRWRFLSWLPRLLGVGVNWPP